MRRRFGTTANVMVPKRTITPTMLALCALLPVSDLRAVGATDRDAAMPFEAITPNDMTKAGMRGTGCAWLTASGRSIRFVVSGDRAVVKLRGTYHWLKPARDAADMFPFTHDRWIGDDMAVRIVVGGTSSLKVGEALGAMLEIMTAGHSSKHHGNLDCGT